MVYCCDCECGVVGAWQEQDAVKGYWVSLRVCCFCSMSSDAEQGRNGLVGGAWCKCWDAWVPDRLLCAA